MTRYHIIADGEELPAMSKRQTMFAMVTNLIEWGVPAAAIEEVIGPRFRSIEGKHKDTAAAFLREYPKQYGGRFAPEWWYTDHPFTQNGRTWLLNKGWDRHTEPTLTALCECFPQANVSFRRADA